MNTQLNWWWWVCMRVCKPVCSLIIEIIHNGDWLLRRWSRQLIWCVSVCLSRRGWKRFIESCLHVRGLRLSAQRTCLIAGCSALFGKSLTFRKVVGSGKNPRLSLLPRICLNRKWSERWLQITQTTSCGHQDDRRSYETRDHNRGRPMHIHRHTSLASMTTEDFSLTFFHFQGLIKLTGLTLSLKHPP